MSTAEKIARECLEPTGWKIGSSKKKSQR